jgi:hypothetical protein
MPKTFFKLLLLISLLVPSSCAPVKIDGYFHPISNSDATRLARRDCCGAAGPEEVLVILGPEDVQLTIVMWHGEKGVNGVISGQEGKGLFGELGIYAPIGSVVDFQSDILVFKNLETENEYVFKIEEVVLTDNRYRTVCPNWVQFARLSSEEGRSEMTPFKGTFQGKGKHGSHIWIELDADEEFGSPEEFRVIFPSMLVNGIDFHPAPVDFIWSAGGYYIYPLNC